MFVCKFCSQSFKRKTNHETTCKSNPDRIPGKNHYSYGAKCSAATRQKISLAASKQVVSQETRDKISRSRIAYLKQNPDQVPYLLNHATKGESYPERYWRKILEDAGIDFIQELRLGRFKLDFVVNGIVDLEIDGEQHYVDPKILRSNLRRDEELRSAGWKVIRIRWADFQRLKDGEREEYVRTIVEICRNS